MVFEYDWQPVQLIRSLKVNPFRNSRSVRWSDKTDNATGCYNRSGIDRAQSEIQSGVLFRLQTASGADRQNARLKHQPSVQRHEAWTKRRQALAVTV